MRPIQKGKKRVHRSVRNKVSKKTFLHDKLLVQLDLSDKKRNRRIIYASRILITQQPLVCPKVYRYVLSFFSVYNDAATS
jgi:hypothetical protein